MTNRLLCRVYRKIPAVRIFAFPGIVSYQGSFASSKIVVIRLSFMPDIAGFCLVLRGKFASLLIFAIEILYGKLSDLRCGFGLMEIASLL